MKCLSISLFGKFCILLPCQTKLVLEPTKVQELFFYLLLHADRPHTREKLAELLWHDSSAAQSRKYLRQALWQLQSILSQDPNAEHLLVVDSEWVQVDPGATYWLDTRTFEEAYNQSQGVKGSGLPKTAAQALMEAVSLYRGDLLENWYQDWCLFQRERLQNIYLTMLHKLMVYCECTRQFEAGIVYGMKMLDCDRAREQAYRQLMRLHFLSGDRTGALRQFERCAAVLRQELDVEPTQRTLDLVHEIQHGHLKSRKRGATTAATPKTADPTPPDLLANLNKLKETLITTQQQVEQNIDYLQYHPEIFLSNIQNQE